MMIAAPPRRPRARIPPITIVGAAMLLSIIACAAFPAEIAPYAPNKFDYKASLKPPSWTHPFGTDNFGRDVLSRVIWAARIDLQIVVFRTVFPAIFGTLFGCVIG